MKADSGMELKVRGQWLDLTRFPTVTGELPLLAGEGSQGGCDQVAHNMDITFL